MKRIAMIALLAMATPAFADGPLTLGWITPPPDPYRGLPCGVGPHTVYRILLVECNPDQSSTISSFQINGKALCDSLYPEEWTDWPRCDGAEQVAKVDPK